ncbi:hypothetical protein IAD21_00612 [Abditibacteriota bacterium]|nr:hypothetical protein IAD21_00612 [Abditibacteriota bacterium]
MEDFTKPLPHLRHTSTSKQRQWAIGVRLRAWKELQAQNITLHLENKGGSISPTEFKKRKGQLEKAASNLRSHRNPKWFIDNRENMNLDFLATCGKEAPYDKPYNGPRATPEQIVGAQIKRSF